MFIRKIKFSIHFYNLSFLNKIRLQNTTANKLEDIIKIDMEFGLPLYISPYNKLIIAPASIEPVPIAADTVPAFEGKRFIAKEVDNGIT